MLILRIEVSGVIGLTDQKPRSNPWKAVGLVSAIGVDIVLFMALGFWAGEWFSGRQGGQPIWIVIGIMTGFLIGILTVVLLVKSVLGDD